MFTGADATWEGHEKPSRGEEQIRSFPFEQFSVASTFRLDSWTVILAPVRPNRELF